MINVWNAKVTIEHLPIDGVLLLPDAFSKQRVYRRPRALDLGTLELVPCRNVGGD